METENKSGRRIIYFAAAALCPVLITSICLFFKGMLPGQEEALFYGDYLAEYLPFFRHFWHAIFHGGSLEYSFSLGLGSPTLAMYSIFAFSPFSIISYIIKDVTVGGYITWMLKMALSSVAMFFILTKNIKSKDLTALIFSFFYSMNAYVMIYYNNIHFMDIFYILPLLIHFLIVFVKEEKCTGLILCYAFSFINNFFEGFCTGFFSFVIYVLLLWYLDIRGERLKKNVLRYLGAVVIAGLLSAPVILPAVMYVLQHMRVASDFSVIPLRSPLYVINALFFGRKIISVFDSMPAIYCGWPAILLVLAFFTGKEDKKKKLFAAVPVVLLLICIFWHPAYLFMHLFNEPDSFPWRFSFLLVFVLICVSAYECDNHEHKLLEASGLIPALILIICITVGYAFSRYELGGKITIFIVGLNILFLILHYIGRDKKILFYTLSILELLCAVFFQLPQNGIQGIKQKEIGDSIDQLALMKDEIGKDKSAFFRTSIISDSITNESFLADYPGINYFCSFDDSNLINAMRFLGHQARPQQYDSYGNTEFTNMILSVKYQGVIGKNDLYMGSRVLPPVFSVTDDIKNVELTDDPFENQQSMADAMTEDDRILFLPITVGMNANDAVQIEADEETNEYICRKTGEDSVVTWYAPEITEEPAYLYLMTGKSGSGSFDTETVVSGGAVVSQTPLSVPMIHRFVLEEEGAIPAVYLLMNGDMGSEVRFKDLTARSLDTDALQKIYEELEPMAIKIDEFKDNMIRGRVAADEEHSVLFTSIPYDIDWKVRIDGREVETYAVFNNAFLACDISPGMHEVEFVYKDSSLVLGLGAFAIGVLLFLVLIRKNKQ